FPGSIIGGEPGELSLSVVIFLILLFNIVMVILNFLSSRKANIKFEFLDIPTINVDLINIKGENIQAIKLPVEYISSIQDNDKYKEVRKRLFRIDFNDQNTERDGIYVFYGNTDKRIRLYIGQTGNILSRIKNHEKLKLQIYNNILIVTCSDDDFGGNILRELESRLIVSLKNNKKYHIDNNQEKNLMSLNYFDRDVVEKYHYLILKIILRSSF
ncbi:hypothetical protein LCGC14_2446030, partial [marine sediment metagenome]